MASSISTVYHITVFSWYAFIVKTLADKDGEELPAGIFVYGGPWKYLTFLNLVRHSCAYTYRNWQLTPANARSYITECLVWAMLLLLFQLLQMTFFALAAVNDLQSDTKLDSTLVRCKDLLFSVFAFPVGTVRTFSNHIVIFLFSFF